ncbi:MAG: hypothetical protein GY810_17395 [Aureispira sp.]|nr:hypothetical protein [Aureispira sp.]
MVPRVAPYFVFCFLFATSILIGQTTKKVAEHIVLGECVTHLKIDLPASQVELRTTKSSRILVETSVTLSVSNEHLLDYLAQTGRYNLRPIEDKTNHTLTLTKNQKLSSGVLIVKGKEVREDFVYTIYVPSSKIDLMNVEVQDDGVVGYIGD